MAMNIGKPFDLQDELRIGGRASALRILLDAATSGRMAAEDLAQRALKRIERQVALEQTSPQRPEAWLTGMHDIEQSLRQAIDLLAGRPPEQ